MTGKRRNPYNIVRSRHVTEKAAVLQGLETSESNVCSARCKSPKAVFVVDYRASKHDIRKAVEEIYREKKVKVTKVNTITIKPKERRVRGRIGYRAGYKKAVVTFEPGDQIEEV